MKQTDVLIIGGGISGCSAALTLAKEGIKVTIVTSSPHARTKALQDEDVFSASDRSVADLCEALTEVSGSAGCPRALDQFIALAPRCVEELTVSSSEAGLRATLFERVCSDPNIHVLTNRTAVELVTLADHSLKASDAYKRSTCLGAYVINRDTLAVETYLAKETIVATGGMGELFSHTTNSKSARGEGLFLAHRAGARVMHLEKVHFHPISFYAPNDRCCYLPQAFLDEASVILSHRGMPILKGSEVSSQRLTNDMISRTIYWEMLESDTDHVWLDLTRFDLSSLQSSHPRAFEYCISKGYDPSKAPLPVVPAAHHCSGGIAVDRVGQTTVQRLRAVGEVACTGIEGAAAVPGALMMSSLVWGLVCAEDIAKQIKKFAYHFPEVTPCSPSQQTAEPALIEQDWAAIRQIMWSYLGPVKEACGLRRAVGLLQLLGREIEAEYPGVPCSVEHFRLRSAATVARLIAEAAHSQCGRQLSVAAAANVAAPFATL